VGESAQESALPWDRIRPARFARSNDFKPVLDSLVSAHNQRITQDANYQYLLQNISAYDALRKDKSLSLNLKKRQQEREQQDKARLDRENARRTSLGLPTIASLEVLEKSKEEAPDALLGEAAEITADLDGWLVRNRTASTTSEIKAK
jgi:carboxyl-terminal processing protease